ncbi:hypothetical protein AQUCO_02300013v1 [Aquilegia coerulea]|uniref:DUF8040 domain-containing protein n=1 Tax=Aquilegia coerulea TaxID=218851 RepID=A0A2G5DBS2_AQUCA|nr:hypothetical protein AQUCO_02300013v1 [Aquilegia coerulea]
MGKCAFKLLCDHFQAQNYLSSNKHIDLQEKMMIFLNIISHSHSNRYIKFFYELLVGMFKFLQEMIVSPVWDALVGVIRNHRRFREGPFKGTVGALDGTLINAQIPPDQAIPFREECFMTPHRQTRNWLEGFKKGGRAKTLKEKFNHYLSILRTVIGRTFGVLKARFFILKKMPPYISFLHSKEYCGGVYGRTQFLASSDF